jgi:hypothetical protein
MNGERATVRPVTIARLVEVADACEGTAKTSDAIGSALDASDRRAAEVAAEATRIGLLEQEAHEPAAYATSDFGVDFLQTVREGDWRRVSVLLSNHSPHYAVIRAALEELESATPPELLEQLTDQQTTYSFNQTSVDVVCDWGERLGDFQRHAFSGRYYVVKSDDTLGAEFDSALLDAYDALEESVGLGVRQHYVSVPRLRERVCERLRCSRDASDDALVSLVESNIGKLELTGAPRDTTAKDAVLGLKRIEVSQDDGLVTTVQSTDRVLRGVEYRDKQYYYLVDHRPDHPVSPREEGQL